MIINEKLHKEEMFSITVCVSSGFVLWTRATGHVAIVCCAWRVSGGKGLNTTLRFKPFLSIYSVVTFKSVGIDRLNVTRIELIQVVSFAPLEFHFHLKIN